MMKPEYFTSESAAAENSGDAIPTSFRELGWLEVTLLVAVVIAFLVGYFYYRQRRNVLNIQ